jgi:hypothetical protein
MTAWITRRLPADQRLHLIVTALLATAAAHAEVLAPLHWTLAEPWMRALWATGLCCSYELWQHATGRGDGSWNDVAADVCGGGMVALATVA